MPWAESLTNEGPCDNPGGELSIDLDRHWLVDHWVR